MYKRAINGIDMVKIGLLYYLIPECESNFGEDYANALATAVVNTVFSEPPSNETGRLFIQDENNLSKGKLKVSGTFLGFVEGIGRASRHPAKSCSFVFTL